MDFEYKRTEIEKNTETEEDACTKLRKILEKVVKENITEGILLSGGLDTSILAYIGKKYNKDLKAFTLKFKNSQDEKYSKELCEILNIRHYIFDIDEESLMKNIKETIKILNTFDPMEIRNSVAIFSILEFSNNYVKEIMTGDGADELFFGYDFLIRMKKEEREIYAKNMWKNMCFSSHKFRKFFNMKIFSPYLSDEVKNYAIKINDEMKIRNGIGKWILRKTYENLLPNKFVWREKTPIEHGSGTTILKNIFESKINDDEFEKKKLKYRKEGVIIRDKEHLYYYEIFKEIFGDVKKAKESEIKCKGCGAKIEYKNSYCRVCGTTNN